jgi:adenylylsulfate kinase
VSKLPENNLIRHPSLVDLRQREAANGHKAAVIRFTGLPGSGKSTTAHAVERQLFDVGCQTYVLDGDNVRHGMSAETSAFVPPIAKNTCAASEKWQNSCTRQA